MFTRAAARSVVFLERLDVEPFLSRALLRWLPKARRSPLCRARILTRHSTTALQLRVSLTAGVVVCRLVLPATADGLGAFQEPISYRECIEAAVDADVLSAKACLDTDYATLSGVVRQLAAGTQNRAFSEGAAFVHSSLWVAAWVAGDLAGAERQLALAEIWILVLSRSPPVGDDDDLGAQTVRREWSIGVIEYLTMMSHFDRARARVAELLRGAARDPDAMLVAGIVYEGSYRRAVWDRLARGVAATAQSRAAEYRREAETLYRRTLASAPLNVEAGVRLGRLLSERGDTREAKDVLTRVLRDSIASDIACVGYVLLGDLARRGGGLGESGEYYQRALMMRPESQIARLAVALWLDLSGRSDEAKLTVAALASSRISSAGGDPWERYAFGRVEHAMGWLPRWRSRLSLRPH